MLGSWKAAPKLNITFAGQETLSLPGEVVGVDRLSDLAVVKAVLSQGPRDVMKSLCDDKCKVDGRLIPLRFAKRSVEAGEDVVANWFRPRPRRSTDRHQGHR